MPSVESIEARFALQKERVDTSVSLVEERARWDAYAKELPIAKCVTLEMQNLAGVKCAVLTTGGTTAKPIIIYAHGGGHTSGSIITHRSFASELAAATDCTVVLPNFRLLPENPPSAPSDDLIAVHKIIAENGINQKQPIFFGGDSSGAGLSVTAMTRLRDQGAVLPAGCFSISGAFDATLSGGSIRGRQSDDPILSENVLRHWQSHFGKGFAFADPLISPLFANLSGVASTLLIVGEDEVWFDDSKRMHAELSQAGSESEFITFDGMWHVWPMTSGLPETDQAFQLISDFIQRHS